MFRVSKNENRWFKVEENTFSFFLLRKTYIVNASHPLVFPSCLWVEDSYKAVLLRCRPVKGLLAVSFFSASVVHVHTRFSYAVCPHDAPLAERRVSMTPES